MVHLAATFFIALYVVESAFIISGNAFAIFVFWTQQLHQKRTCFLLINLAIADLLVGVAEPIVLAYEKIPKMTGLRGREGSINNPSSALQLFASTSSVFFLALISLERVCAVLWPLRHRTIRTRIYVYGIVIAWLVGFCMGGWSVLSMYYEKVDRAYAHVTIHSCLFISLLVIIGGYLKIRSRLNSPPTEITSHNIRTTELNLRLSRTMFVVIGVSLVFWLPAFAVYIVREFCLQCFSPIVVWLVNALHLANSMVNPFVYTFRMPTFKDALKKLWCKHRRNLRAGPVETGRVAVISEGCMTPQTERSIHTSLDM